MKGLPNLWNWKATVTNQSFEIKSCLARARQVVSAKHVLDPKTLAPPSLRSYFVRRRTGDNAGRCRVVSPRSSSQNKEAIEKPACQKPAPTDAGWATLQMGISNYLFPIFEMIGPWPFIRIISLIIFGRFPNAAPIVYRLIIATLHIFLYYFCQAGIRIN